MGTRGFIIFVIDGQEKVSYSHCDSYPEKLGLSVLRWARVQHENLPLLAERARALRVVDSQAKAPVRYARELRRFAEGPGTPGTWYHLLRGTQHDPGLILLAGVVPDASGFPLEPQALWGYVIDVDASRLEAYRGGQREAHDAGRFARLGPQAVGDLTYWPPALVASWPFGTLPANAAEFTEACYPPEGEE